MMRIGCDGSLLHSLKLLTSTNARGIVTNVPVEMLSVVRNLKLPLASFVNRTFTAASSSDVQTTLAPPGLMLFNRFAAFKKKVMLSGFAKVITLPVKV